MAHGLREGGRELLRLGGEASGSLLAGAGLVNLRAVLTQLDEEVKSLVGDGRGRRRLSDAVEAWRKATARKARSARWRRAPGSEAEAAHAAFGDAIGQRPAADLNFGRGEQSGSSGCAASHRCWRNSPRHARASHSWGRPASAAQCRKSRFQALVAAQRDAARGDSERETVEVHAADRRSPRRWPKDALILAVQGDAIDALVAQRAIVLQATNDLPKVQQANATNSANEGGGGHSRAWPSSPALRGGRASRAADRGRSSDGAASDHRRTPR